MVGSNNTAAIAISTFTGGISNAGTISGGVAAIFVGNAPALGGNQDIASLTIATFDGGITNAGLIRSSGKGIFLGGSVANGVTVAVSTFSGGITNTGTILAGTGIVVNAQVLTFSGAISNSGTISGSKGTAIDVSHASNAITIDQNAGLSPASQTFRQRRRLNITGGSIAGNIVGSARSDTVNFNPGAGKTFTYGSSYGFSGIHQVNVTSGTVVLNGNNAATALTVSNGGTLAGTGTIASSITINSGGTLEPGLPRYRRWHVNCFRRAQFRLGRRSTSRPSAVRTRARPALSARATLGGATVMIATGSTVSAGTQYVIMADTGGEPASAATLSIRPFQLDNMTGTISYVGGDDGSADL